MAIVTKLILNFIPVAQAKCKELWSNQEYVKHFKESRLGLLDKSGFKVSDDEKKKQDLTTWSSRCRKIDYVCLVSSLIQHMSKGFKNVAQQSASSFLKKYLAFVKKEKRETTTVSLAAFCKALSNPQTEVMLDAFLAVLHEKIYEAQSSACIHELFQQVLEKCGKLTAADGSFIPTVSSNQGLKLHLLFDIHLKDFLSYNLSSGFSNERTHLLQLLPETIKAVGNIVVMGDAGYFSFALMQGISDLESYFLFKVRINISCHGARILTAINEKGQVLKQLVGQKLSQCSIDVKLGETIDFLVQDPNGTIYRVIRTRKLNADARISKKAAYVYFITNIPLKDFSAESLVLLYHFRWTIENAFKDLKSGNGLSDLCFKNPFSMRVFVKASLASYLLKYLFSFIAIKTAEKEGKPLGELSIHKVMRNDGFPIEEIFDCLFKVPHQRRVSCINRQPFYKKLKDFLGSCEKSVSSQKNQQAFKDLGVLAEIILEKQRKYPLILSKMMKQLDPTQTALLVKKYC